MQHPGAVEAPHQSGGIKADTVSTARLVQWPCFPRISKENQKKYLDVPAVTTVSNS